MVDPLHRLRVDWKCLGVSIQQHRTAVCHEVLRSSDAEARKLFLNEFNIYLMMEKAYQSGKLQDRIAPRCNGAFEGKNIDVLILDLHDSNLDSWEQLQPPEW